MRYFNPQPTTHMEPTESEKLAARILALLKSEDNRTRFDADESESLEIVREYCNNHHITEPDADTLNDIEESYCGYFSSHREFAEHIVDDCGLLNDIPSNLAFYFDYEKYGNDLFLSGDFWMSEGHVFRSI